MEPNEAPMQDDNIKSEPIAPKTQGGVPPFPESKQSIDKLGLEEIVHIANRVGLDYVEAKKKAEWLELMRATVRARIMLRLDDGTLTEVKLKRLGETDPEYIDHLEEYTQAKAESERLRVRYESYKNLFDAKRSLLSYQKAEMKLI